MERFINEQEKKKKKQAKKKKKNEEKKSKPKVVKLKLKVRRRAPQRIPSPVDPWMVLSDDDDEVDNEEDVFCESEGG